MTNIDIKIIYNDKANFTNIIITRTNELTTKTDEWTIPHKSKEDSATFQKNLFALLYYEAYGFTANEFTKIKGDKQ